MARLNEKENNNAEAVESLKKRYLRQNREIARANSAQSVRIRQLESESTRLLTENISLREQVIRLQAQLDRRDRNKQIAENVESVQRKLQEKWEEANLIIKELNMPLHFSSPQKSNGDGSAGSDSSPYLDPRLLRTSYDPREGLEGYLPAISENPLSRRSSAESGRRRSSLTLAEIDLPPPAPALYHSDSDLAAEPSSPEELAGSITHVQSKPRRRRDSFSVPRGEIVPEPTKATPTKLPKRKFTEREIEAIPSSPDLDFRFSKVSERAAAAVRQQMESEVFHSSPPAHEEENEEIVEEHSPIRPVSATKRSTERQVSSTATLSAAVGRKALRPKSTNTDPTNSPLKTAAREREKEPEKEKVVNKPQPASMKPRRGAGARDKDTPPPEMDPAATVTTATGRAARRTRPTVSYVEPSLRAKMRREESGFVDAVGGLKRTRSTPSVSPSAGVKRKASVEREVTVKKEEEEDEDWKELPMKAAVPTEDTGLPASVVTSRRRRLAKQLNDPAGGETKVSFLHSYEGDDRPAPASDRKIPHPKSFASFGETVEKTASTRRRSIML